MLALTDNAVEAVKNIVSSSDEDSETSGLRMVAERAGTQANFQLSVVSLPAEDDEVIEEQGVRVFLEPEAASLLEDKVLDASLEQNQVAFTIADQIEELAAEFAGVERSPAGAGWSLRACSREDLSSRTPPSD